MASLNKVLLMGNLTRDPELKYIASGQAVSTLGLAVNRRFKTKSGESKEEVLFVNIEVWGRMAENCSRYLKKGSPIYVEGRLRIREYVPRGEESTGRKRYVTEIVAQTVQFLSGGPRGERDGGGAPAEYGASPSEGVPADVPVEEPYPNLDEEGQ